MGSSLSRSDTGQQGIDTFVGNEVASGNASTLILLGQVASTKGAVRCELKSYHINSAFRQCCYGGSGCINGAEDGR